MARGTSLLTQGAWESRSYTREMENWGKVAAPHPGRWLAGLPVLSPVPRAPLCWTPSLLLIEPLQLTSVFPCQLSPSAFSRYVLRTRSSSLHVSLYSYLLVCQLPPRSVLHRGSWHNLTLWGILKCAGIAITSRSKVVVSSIEWDNEKKAVLLNRVISGPTEI